MNKRNIEGKIAKIKKDFHKEMAKLSIEEKIKIVRRLQEIDYSIKPEEWKKKMIWRV